jgi:hypothetical protein
MFEIIKSYLTEPPRFHLPDRLMTRIVLTDSSRNKHAEIYLKGQSHAMDIFKM